MADEPPDDQAVEVKKLADAVAAAADADILFLNSDIERGVDDIIFALVRSRRRRQNIVLIITTRGGDADAAYRIARCLQESYKHFSVLVGGYCKSAGTLCILGANEVVMLDCAEIGPLDVQLFKKDELGVMDSGLVLNTALRALEQQAFAVYEYCMLEIEKKGGGLITFKTATEIAAKMAIGLLQPVYQQIDPMKVGEVTRSMSIARAYGMRLEAKSKNFTKKTLEMLIDTYPSHGFVIDRHEASQLFAHVRGANELEQNLLWCLGEDAMYPGEDRIEFLSAEIEEVKHEGQGSAGAGESADNARGSGNEANTGGAEPPGGPAPEGEAGREHLRAVPKAQQEGRK